MAKEFTQEDDAPVWPSLGVEVETKKAVTRTPREERIIVRFRRDTALRGATRFTRR